MNFMFLNNPRGGVEDLQYVKAKCPWVGGVFCNIRDYPVADWEKVIRPRALALGFVCGAWARTGHGGAYDYGMLNKLAAVGRAWNCPIIVNSEKEIDNSGSSITKIIADTCKGLDAWLSTEPWLFPSVDWSPVAYMPLHLQIFPLEAPSAKDPLACRQHAWNLGMQNVYFTYGTSEQVGYKPSMFDLKADYSLFTGDPPMSSYTLERWAPTSSGHISTKPKESKPMLTEQQVPYTGVYAASGKGGPSAKHKGPTAEALARMLARMGFLPWGDFDQPFGPIKEKALKEFQKSVKLDDDGIYDKPVWTAARKAIVPKGRPHEGEYAFDLYARKLIQDEYGLSTPSGQLSTFRTYFVEFCNAAIANEDDWHYSQNRPFKLNINPSATYVESDCSAFGVQAADYARRKADLMEVILDPAQQRWSGYGNTDLHEDNWPRIGAPFRVGDIAHFHSSRHVVWCIKPGTFSTAEWVSHGSERGPERIVLTTYYRFPEEYMYTVRPEYVPNSY